MSMLLIDMKEVFDYISRNYLRRNIENMEADSYLIRWTESFLLGRSVDLVINIHQCADVR